MAVIDLKNEKRIITNGQVDKVTTHPNNEPIFRQNGYQLELDAANSEYINGIITNQIDVNPNDLDININTNNLSYSGVGVDYIFNTAFNPSVNQNYCYIRVQDANSIRISIGASAFSYSIDVSTVYNIRLDGQEFYVNGVLVNTLNTSAPFITLYSGTYIGADNLPSNFINGNINSFRIQNETFNPQDINSSAQIVGSSGTIAQVNTSAAGGTSYILGTVFQKSSFALGFDSSNNEYLEFPSNTNWIDTTDCDFEIDFDWSGQTSTTTYITIGNINSNGVYIDVASNGTLRFRQYNSSGDNILFNVATVVSGRNHFSISGGNITLNGTNYTPPIETLNIVSGVTKIAKFFTFGAWYDFTLYGFSVDNETFNLTEGLGATTNGAQIITSAADSNERINFGMWQKNGNVLEFDAANQDTLLFSNTLVSDVSIAYTFDNTGNPFDAVLFGNTTNSNTFLISNAVNSSYHLRDDNSDNYYFVGIPDTREMTTVRLTDNGSEYELFVNGLSLGTHTYSVGGVTFNKLNNRGNGTGNPRDIDVYSMNLNGKEFQFREGNGETTTSEDGTTTATINTGRTGGGIVGSNNNYLQFDSANSEYLSLINETITNLSDFQFGIVTDYEVKSGIGESIFAWGNFTNEDSIWIYQSDITFVFAVYSSGSLIEQYSVSYPLGLNSLNIDFNNLELRINGVLVKTFLDVNVSNLSSTTINPNISRYTVAGQYCDQTVKEFNIQGKTFQFREGSGATTTSEDGTTTATINTSHANGISYINNSIWGNDSWTSSYYIDNEVWNVSKNKWIDYKKQ